MNRVLVTRVLAAILAVGLPGSAAAQSKTGTAIGQFLGIEPSARIAAMGNAGAALYDGIQSVYYNPAALGALDRPAAEFTHSAWFAGINFDYAAVAFQIRNWGTFFGGVTALNSGEIDVRTVSQPLGTGERYTVSNVALGFGYGRQFTQRFAAGIQANFVTETIWNTSATLTAFNVGTLYILPESGLKIGASLSNLGTRSRFDGRDLAIQFDADPDRFGDNSALPGTEFTEEFPLPILFRVGVSYPFRFGSESELLILVDGSNPSDNTESLSAGAEWTWKRALALRAGYQNLFQEDSELGVTLGAGIQAGFGNNRFYVDYAWADHERLQETHRTTFILTF
jgi:long-subunit fatty acid transport protein